MYMTIVYTHTNKYILSIHTTYSIGQNGQSQKQTLHTTYKNWLEQLISTTNSSYTNNISQND